MVDLLRLTAELVDIPSVSHDENAIANHIEAAVRDVPWLTVDRVGDNVVARTSLGRSTRVVLAGHTDTVPVNDNDRARIDGDTLWGLGSSDMKAGVAVALELARTISEPALDVTYVFYACEEVQAEFNGLCRLLADRPDLLAADAAILGEPTNSRVEAGCQGTISLGVTFAGARAHTARPWMGINAIHRMGGAIARVAAYEGRRPVLNGCEFREAMQAVGVEGFVARNVVPDRATLTINHRFAPDRTRDAAFETVRDVLGDSFDDAAGDSIELLDESLPAAPALDHPVIAGLVERSGQPPLAKLGWTDVAFFAAAGTPATNFGPGDPTLAHTRDERVERSALDAAHATLRGLLLDGV